MGRLCTSPALVPLACCTLVVEGRRRHLEVFRRAVGTKELLSLVEPNERVVGAVVFGVAKFVAGRCRRLVRGRVRVSVEVARLVQELRLDVFDGRREGPEFLTEFLGVRLRLLAIVTDHEDELVDDVVEDGLGDGGGGVSIVPHSGGTVG